MRGKWVLRRIDKILNKYVAQFDLSARLDSDFIYYYVCTCGTGSRRQTFYAVY